MPPLRYDSVEMDELVVRFRLKRRYRYLWIAVSRLTRQVLAVFLGDRSIRSLRTLWSRVPPAYRRKLVYTDEYEVYAKLLRPWQHRPSAKGSGRTSVAEGLNNKWRSRISGLVRRTVCVRYKEDLVRRLLLTFDQHNRLCRRRVEEWAWLEPPTH
ncbi:hypothetical protein BH23GEM7_BH23GEM7_39450 [soil metagenome]